MPSSDPAVPSGKLSTLLRKVTSRLVAGGIEGPDALEPATADGVSPCGEVTGRQWRTLQGRLTSVTIRPLGTTPALEADLSDETGAVTIVWIGRHEIPGIVPGARMRVFGMVAVHDGQARLYNPRYDLLAPADGPD